MARINRCNLNAPVCQCIRPNRISMVQCTLDSTMNNYLAGDWKHPHTPEVVEVAIRSSSTRVSVNSSAVRTDGTPKCSGVFFTNLQMFSLALRGYNSEISGTSPGLSVSRKAPKLRDSFQSEKLVISFSDRTSFIHLKSLSNAEEEKYEREVTTERSSTRGLFISSGVRIVEMSRCSSVFFIPSLQFSVPFRRYREAWLGMRPV